MRIIIIGGISIVAFALILTLHGCGAPGGAPGLEFGGYGPTRIDAMSWERPVASICYGRVQSVGETAHNVRVEFWYTTAQGESVRVLSTVPSTIEPYHYGFLTVPAQISNGELRYPAIGRVLWDGGSLSAEPRKPVMSFGCVHWLDPDSLEVWILNTARAYHTTLTYESRDGLHTIPLLPDPFPAGGRSFHALPRDSSGVQLSPRILKIRWEDYGGVPDSVLEVPTDSIRVGCS